MLKARHATGLLTDAHTFREHINPRIVGASHYAPQPIFAVENAPIRSVTFTFWGVLMTCGRKVTEGNDLALDLWLVTR